MQCQEILASGQQCGGFAIEDSEFCFTHDPDMAAERAEARSRGGRARQVVLDPEVRRARVQELKDGGLKQGLATLLGVLADAEALENSVARARTIGYLLSVMTRLEFALDKKSVYDFREYEDEDED